MTKVTIWAREIQPWGKMCIVENKQRIRQEEGKKKEREREGIDIDNNCGHNWQIVYKFHQEDYSKRNSPLIHFTMNESGVLWWMTDVKGVIHRCQSEWCVIREATVNLETETIWIKNSPILLTNCRTLWFFKFEAPNKLWDLKFKCRPLV